MTLPRLSIGICSWTDRTLLKSGFYPPSARTPAARLAFYASQFDTVEVDSTYYALPDHTRVVRWIAGTPRTFQFGVKSFSLFTFHRAKYAALPKWLKEELGPRDGAESLRREDLTHEQRTRLFEDFIAPVRLMHQAGRLAYLLYQFPPYWRFCKEGLVYFKRLREVSGPLPLAVEVRNNTWFEPGNRELFLKALEKENIAYVAVDEPNIGWTAPPEWPLTAEWGTLVRFHGRNVAGWRNPRASVAERFDYRYSRPELEEWAPRVERTAALLESAMRAEDTRRPVIYLMYNNCVGDKAVQSARLMKELLGIRDDSPPEGRQTVLELE